MAWRDHDSRYGYGVNSAALNDLVKVIAAHIRASIALRDLRNDVLLRTEAIHRAIDDVVVAVTEAVYCTTTTSGEAAKVLQAWDLVRPDPPIPVSVYGGRAIDEEDR